MTNHPRHRHGPRCWSSSLLLLAYISLATCGYSQEAGRDQLDKIIEAPSPLALDELPPPPRELAELIDAGRVTFVVGGQRPSESEDAKPNTTTTQRYDRDFRERGYGRRGRWGRRLSFDAETNFQVHLDYRSRCRWRIRWKDDQRHLLVSIRFSNLKVEPTHKIWLKNSIPEDQFWDSPLVRHEFDHVKLSVMVASEKSFAADLREHATIDVVIDGDADVNQAMVLPMVDKRVKERFAELLDLIEIRYQELDRQTRHGTRPLDQESELFPLLRDTDDEPQAETRTPARQHAERLEFEVPDLGAGESN